MRTEGKRGGTMLKRCVYGLFALVLVIVLAPRAFTYNGS